MTGSIDAKFCLSAKAVFNKFKESGFDIHGIWNYQGGCNKRCMFSFIIVAYKHVEGPPRSGWGKIAQGMKVHDRSEKGFTKYMCANQR